MEDLTLEDNITNFLQYCKDLNLSLRSIESLAFRLHEFNQFIQSQAIAVLKQINFQLLTRFVTDNHNPSISVKKARGWCLRLPRPMQPVLGQVPLNQFMV